MKIVFQGDSITDVGRLADANFPLGFGYPRIAAELAAQRFPERELEFVNRGIGGDKTEDLLKRWSEDAIDLAPDIISIMIGVNDVWHHAEARDWLPHAEFEANYRELLTRLRAETGAKIVILEPYLLFAPDKEYFREDLDPKIQVVRRLAREFADVLVPLDGLFAAAALGREPLFYSFDGVHPTEEGARFIAERYVEAVAGLIEAYED